MATIDGLLVGVIVGALGTAGVWVFVESESSSSVYAHNDARYFRPEASGMDAPVAQPVGPLPPSVARSTPPTSRKSARARTARAAAPAQLEATVEGAFMPGGYAGPSEPEEVVAPEARTTSAESRRHRFGLALGSGAELALSRGLGAGVQWNVTLFVEPHEHLGLEFGYVGTTGTQDDSSSVEVLARWYPQSERPIRYYALAGVGWRRFHTRHTDVAAVPVGFGLALQHGQWRADTRLTLRAASRSAFHTLGITANVGHAF